MNNIRLAIRSLNDCIEFPIYPIMPEKTQMIKGHITFPPKGRDHDLIYVKGQMAKLIGIGIKEITIHTLGLNLTKLVEIADFAKNQGIILNIENRRGGRTSRIKDLTKILWATGADLTLDIGHCRSNNTLDSYLKEFNGIIHNIHLYSIEDSTGHIPIKNYREFKNIADKLVKLEKCNWWVLEANNVKEIIKWYTKFLDDLTN